MLSENEPYLQAVRRAFPDVEYDPIADCVNYLFHRHTAELPAAFRSGAREVLIALIERRDTTPVVLTNSRGDKVRRHLATVALNGHVTVLGDTRQYEMAPDWDRHFVHPDLGQIQVWPISKTRQVDLRRPAYFRALASAVEEDPRLVVLADTFSLPGALPLMMGIPFLLLRTVYTPAWCARAVSGHPLGRVVDVLADVPAALDALEA
jgi:hypothetical protein